MNSGSHRETAGSYSTSLVFKTKVPVSMQQQHSRVNDENNQGATEQQEQNKTKDCCGLFAAGKTTTKVNTSVVVLLFVVIGLCCWLSVEGFAGVSQNQWELRYQSQ
jgi:hypothetical protein